MPILKIATCVLRLLVAGLQREAAAADRKADRLEAKLSDSVKEEKEVIDRIKEQYSELRGDIRDELLASEKNADAAHRMVVKLGALV